MFPRTMLGRVPVKFVSVIRSAGSSIGGFHTIVFPSIIRPSRKPPSHVDVYTSPWRRASFGLRPLFTHTLYRSVLLVVTSLPAPNAAMQYP